MTDFVFAWNVEEDLPYEFWAELGSLMIIGDEIWYSVKISDTFLCYSR